VAGHAGVFSTARDLAIFAQMILNGGRYGNVRILKPETVLDMVALQTKGFFDKNGISEDRGLGFELNAPYYMGRLASLTTVVRKKSFVIFLSNTAR
jgi:CubicO group peptidase (beta-lactamase class C family)